MLATGIATWEGDWKHGHGNLATDSKTLVDAPYSFSSRFEGTPGGSPEELLAAGHAGCFNQAFANNFGMIHLMAQHIATKVSVEITTEDGHPVIKGIHIATEAQVTGITQEQFDHCAERARTNCTIAKLMKLDPTMTATLLA